MLSPANFAEEGARAELCAVLGEVPGSLGSAALVRACGAVLGYARLTQQGRLEMVRRVVRFEPGAHMRLPDAAVRVAPRSGASARGAGRDAGAVLSRGSGLDADGGVGVGLPAPGADPVTLSRSTSLSFFLATARDGPCTPATELVVALEGAGGELRTATAMQVCGGALGVGPVQRLADDE